MLPEKLFQTGRKPPSLKVNALLNVVKTGLSMIFPFITLPYATRILQVENLGKVTFSSSVISYFLLLASAGTTYAVREGSGIRNDRSELRRFLREIFTIKLFFLLLAYGLLFLTIIGSPKLESYWVLLMIQSVTLIGNVMGCSWIFQIEENFLYITLRSIFVQTVSLLLLFVLVHSSEDYILYAGISVFAQTAADFFNFAVVCKKYKLFPTLHPQWKRHIRSILFLLFSDVSSTIYIYSDTTMLGFFCGDYYVGIYSVSSKIYSMVKSLATAVMAVMLPRLSYKSQNEKGEEEYSHLVNSLFEILFIWITPMAVGIFMTSESIVLLLFGQSYLPAVNALKILIIAAAFSTVSILITQTIMLPLKMDKKLMTTNAMCAVINVALNIFFIPYFRQLGAAITTLVAEFSILIMQWFSIRRKARLRIPVKTGLAVLFGCSAIVLICFSFEKLPCYYLVRFAIEVCCSAAAYGFIMSVLGIVHIKQRVKE